MTLIDGVHPALGAALAERGYETLTSVQKTVIEAETVGRDLLVSAQTGSGKTVAFGLAMGPTLMPDDSSLPTPKRPLALVIAPTRELALQVKAELSWLYAACGAHLASCVGGMDMRKERRDLARGCHILVCTPGRLRDHIERGSVDLQDLRVAVLDEADEMLDLGFREDLEFILGNAPDDRQTLLFSATVPRGIAELAKTYQRNALRLSTAEERKQHADIDYHAHLVAAREKEKAVINVLRYYEAPSTMIFCSTREMVRHLSSRLTNRGFAVVSLSGELSQAERSHALQAMRDGRARICVATDVAARGIDLPNLDLVVHADLPTNSETLLHRSGRTGRAGRKGHCVIIAPHNKRHVVNRLLKFAQLRVHWGPVPDVETILERDKERMFNMPLLQNAADEDQLVAARELLERFSAEQVAAAFIASQQATHPAPEEVVDMPTPKEDRGAPQAREEFDGGIWFRINTGRKHKAEPRWLLPLICRIGGFTKKKVGFIRILDSDTVFEMSPDVADDFTHIIENEGTGEKSLRIIRLAEKPVADLGPRGGGGGRKGGGGGYRGKGGGGRGGPGGSGGRNGERSGGKWRDGPRGGRDDRGGKGGKGGKPYRGKGKGGHGDGDRGPRGKR